MKTFQILLHSWHQLFGNLRQALLMSPPPLLIQAGALVLFLLAAVLRPVAQGVGPSEGLPVLSVRPTLTPATVLGLALA